MGKRERKREKKRKVNVSARKPPRAALKAKKAEGGGAGGGGAAPKAAKKAALKEAGRSELEQYPTTLVIGDGDFSFSKALLRRVGGSGAGIVATSFDRSSARYKKMKDHMKHLKAAGVTTKLGVDGTKLADAFGPGERFSRIIFNYPHSGQQRVHVNRALLMNFFESAKGFLCSSGTSSSTKASRGGEVHVCMSNRGLYKNWNIVEQATTAGLRLVRSRDCCLPEEYPGYVGRDTGDTGRDTGREGRWGLLSRIVWCVCVVLGMWQDT